MEYIFSEQWYYNKNLLILLLFQSKIRQKVQEAFSG